MSARGIVIRKLLTAAAVTQVAGERIFPSQAPQDATKPYILVHKPAQQNEQMLGGDAGYPQARVSLEIVGRTGAEVDSLGKLIFDSLKNVTNETVDDGQSPATVYGRDVTIIPTDFDVDDYSDARKSFRRIIDFYVRFRAP